MTIRTEDVTGFSRERIIEQIRGHGEIMTKTDDPRCNKKKYQTGKHMNLTRYGQKNNEVYQKHLAKLDAEILKNLKNWLNKLSKDE